jgi:uncharacterized protein DUF397
VNGERLSPSITWRKSSYSGDTGGSCVETMPLTTSIGVRDSKDLTVGHIAVDPVSWSALIGSIKTA